MIIALKGYRMNIIVDQSVLHSMMSMYSYYVLIDLGIALYHGLCKGDTEYSTLWNTKWQLAVFYWIAYIMKGV